MTAPTTRWRRFAAPLVTAALSASHHDRSLIRISEVCTLDDAAALVTLDFARVRRDGSVLVEGTAIHFYFFYFYFTETR